MSDFSTLAVHGRHPQQDESGALRTPIYETVSFEHHDARSMQLTFEGKKAAYAYSRISNPTVSAFEQRISAISRGGFTLAIASGMAAISNTILTLAGSGTNIVTTKKLFGNTLSLLQKTLAPWGLETRFVDMKDLQALKEAIDNKTRLVFLESVTNPHLEVADCAAIAKVCKAKGIPVVLDNTIMTPYLFDAGKAGIAIEVLSSTKFISGGATTVGGLIIDHNNFDWNKAPRLSTQAQGLGPMAFIATLRQEIYRNLGACMAPHTAYMQTLGLETLGLRIEKSCANASRAALFLSQHPKVRQVNYPGLAGSPYHALATQQFSGRYGGIVTFDLATKEECFQCIDALKRIRRATNINDNKSLVLHPYSTIFAEYSSQEKEEMGIRPTTIRLSIGIESSEDIVNDIAQGLDSLLNP